MYGRYIKYGCLIIALFFTISGQAGTLFLGSIGDDPDEEIKEFNALAMYLQKRLHLSGITQVKTVVASNTKEMINLISDKKVHIYIDSPFPSILVERETGSSIFLRRWKKGVAEYRSVIFARKDSGIDSLEKMKGHRLAFEDPYSTSSYFLPKAVLSMQGLTLKHVEAGEIIAKNIIGYQFSDDDRNTMIWVLKKKVALGAMNETHFKKLARKQINNLHIIDHSMWVPRHVVSYAPGMSNEFVNTITKILVHMHESQEGQEALRQFSKTTKFDEFPNGVRQDMMPLRQLIDN